MIRKEARSDVQWYELTHDRLIKPIKDSNQRWYEKEIKHSTPLSANRGVGRGPSFVSIDPKMQKVYVASKQGKSVSVIDIKTDKVVDTIAVGRGLDGLTVDTKTDKVYVSDK